MEVIVIVTFCEGVEMVASGEQKVRGIERCTGVCWVICRRRVSRIKSMVERVEM